MRLSVIVTSYGSRERLRACLESLVTQRDADEIIVADCSPADPGEELAALFPAVRFLHFTEKRRVPELRWAAFRSTGGGIVAAVESRCVPAPDWCALLKRAHERHPEAPAIGGPVKLAPGAKARDTALYWCEYGHYAPPLPEGPTYDLSGANLSYKRAALDCERDLLDAGQWETVLHARWRAAPKPLRLCGAAVEFQNTMRVPQILRQRLSYGRGYAAERVRNRSFPARLAYALGTALLPLLMLARISRDAIRTANAAALVKPFPWCALFCVCWSAGEAVGYLFGPSPRAEIF